jgi:plastocyanin
VRAAAAAVGSPRPGRHARLWVAIAGLAIVAAACGSGATTPGFTYAPASQPASSSNPPAASSSPPSAAGSTVALSLKEYSITPLTVTVKAGTPVVFEARNDGTISHALVISGNGVSLATKDLAFQPGTTEPIAVTLAAGSYTFICPVDSHAAQGMQGTITVTP